MSLAWNYNTSWNIEKNLKSPSTEEIPSDMWVITNILAMPVGESQNGRFMPTKKIDAINDQ